MKNDEKKGVAFKNDRKTGEKHPDFKGWFMLDGKEWDIALWEREGAKAGKFYSIGISEPYRKEEDGLPETDVKPEAKEPSSKKKNEPYKKPEDDDSGLPFWF